MEPSEVKIGSVIQVQIGDGLWRPGLVLAVAEASVSVRVFLEARDQATANRLKSRVAGCTVGHESLHLPVCPPGDGLGCWLPA